MDNVINISRATDVVKKRLDEQTVDMGGLTDRHLHFINYFVTHYYKVPKHQTMVFFYDRPRLILIIPKAMDGKPVVLKPKSSDLFDDFLRQSGLAGEYSISFASREQIDKYYDGK